MAFVDLSTCHWRQCLEDVQKGAALDETVAEDGRRLKAIISHQIFWCAKEKLSRLVMAKVNAETRKSRQPLSSKIKSRRASLDLNKM